MQSASSGRLAARRAWPLAALAIITAARAVASCPGGAETVLSCTAKGAQKALDVCVEGAQISYRYGPLGGAPELELLRGIAEIENRPWPGIGRTLWEDTTFRNEGYAYVVYLSVDRLNEAAEPEGGVFVMRAEEKLAEVACDPGSATLGFWAISDAKQALGICWDQGAHDWGNCD